MPRPPRRLLLTAFEPFGGMSVNPSWEAIRELDGELWGRVIVRAVRLPVSFARAPGLVREALETFRPDALVMFGLAQKRTGITLESLARNRNDAAAKDNEGVSHAGPIDANGPATAASRLPLDRIRRALSAGGFPVEESDDAGGYLCNRVFWEALSATKVPAGFVHLPPFEALAPERLKSAVRAVAEAVAFEEIPVAVAQFAPVFGDVERNVATMERLAREAASGGARLVLFPELATTGLSFRHRPAAGKVAEPKDGPTAARMSALSRELNVLIAWGYVESDAGNLFNSALLVEPGGARHGYRKRRLYGHDGNWATAGEAPGIFETALGRVSLAICHDCVYSDVAADSADVDLALLPTNWIGDEGPEAFLRGFGAPVLVADRLGREDGIAFHGRGGLYAAGAITGLSESGAECVIRVAWKR